MASVLITGASKGIGRAIAVELADRGHRAVATARDPRTLDDLPVAHRVRLDVTDQESVDAAVAAAGPVDVLVSNAGAIFRAAVEASPIDEVRRLFEQNTFGSLRVAQAVLPQMRERGNGRLLFLSSFLGRIVLPGSAVYASTKWALEALVEALAVEVAHFGVQAALLQPGAVSSGALDDVLTHQLPDDPYAPLLGKPRDLGPMMTPREVAVIVADAVEAERIPLRIPVGGRAAGLLAARKAAAEDVPFPPVPAGW